MDKNTYTTILFTNRRGNKAILRWPTRYSPGGLEPGHAYPVSPGYTVPFVNDVEGVNDPEYLYINGTVYQVIETGAINLWNRPVAGISATGSLQAVLSANTPVSVPLPLTSKYAYVIDGVTVQVNKLTILPGQVVHLVTYPWLQQGEIAYALNYGLINSSVLYAKYSSVSNLTTTSITYPSF